MNRAPNTATESERQKSLGTWEQLLGDGQDQARLDGWVRQRTDGLIAQTPIAVTPGSPLVLSVDPLPDRKPETVLAWLEQHDPPDIISRDPGTGYAEAATRGAAAATQVPDRFHRTKNLVESLETLFLRKPSVLKEGASILAEERAPPQEELPQDTMYRAKRKHARQQWQERAEEASQYRYAERIARYKAIRALRGV
jgi:transposase